MIIGLPWGETFLNGIQWIFFLWLDNARKEKKTCWMNEVRLIKVWWCWFVDRIGGIRHLPSCTEFFFLFAETLSARMCRSPHFKPIFLNYFTIWFKTKIKRRRRGLRVVYRVFTEFFFAALRGGGWGGSGRGANLNLNARATRRRRKRRRRDAASISRALRGRRRDAPSTDAEFFVVFASFAFVVTFTEFYRVLQRGKKSGPSAEVLKDRWLYRVLPSFKEAIKKNERKGRNHGNDQSNDLIRSTEFLSVIEPVVPGFYRVSSAKDGGYRVLPSFKEPLKWIRTKRRNSYNDQPNLLNRLTEFLSVIEPVVPGFYRVSRTKVPQEVDGFEEGKARPLAAVGFFFLCEPRFFISFDWASGHSVTAARCTRRTCGCRWSGSGPTPAGGWWPVRPTTWPSAPKSKTAAATPSPSSSLRYPSYPPNSTELYRVLPSFTSFSLVSSRFT